VSSKAKYSSPDSTDTFGLQNKYTIYFKSKKLRTELDDHTKDFLKQKLDLEAV
jgi:hypothetical protein